MNLIKSRHCKRAFLNTPVERAILETVLHTSGNAGSSKNTQPWKVAVLTEDALKSLSDKMLTKYDRGEIEKPDYTYSLDPMPSEWTDRARACGYALFDLKGIARDDIAARKAHARENYRFFGAPVGMIFYLPKGSQYGNFLDMGMFLQNVMLGLVDHGLGSCPQASLRDYSQTIREHLGLVDEIIVCGLSVGYVDLDAKVNTFVPERLALEEYVSFKS